MRSVSKISLIGLLVLFISLTLVYDVCADPTQLPTLSASKIINPSIINEGDNTTITFNLNGTGVPQGARNNVDVMLIMDRSGSMEGAKIGAAKEAAKTLVGQLNSSFDNIGLVSFSNVASLEKDLTSNYVQVISSIDDLSADTNMYKNTNVGDGIMFATSRLTTSSHVKVEILLSDGRANVPLDAVNYALGKAQLAADSHIVIYTISLGNDADRTLMQKIANMTGGKEYYSPSTSELQQIFLNISREFSDLVASDVLISDVLPVGVEPINTPSPCTYNSTLRTLNCIVGLVSIGDSLNYSFDVRVSDPSLTHANIYSVINYTGYNGLPNLSIVIDPQPTIRVIPNCGNGIISGSEQCEAPFDVCCNSSTCQFKSSQIVCRSSSGQCDIAETCTGSSAVCPIDGFASQGTNCNDGLYCTIDDKCDGVGNCINHDERNCSSSNLVEISTCLNNPDDNPFTFDFRSPFTSFCNEQTDSCISGDTSGASNISHSCNISCGAECIQNSDCDDGNSHTADSCLESCICQHITLECINNDDCSNMTKDYCNGDTTMHDEGVCVDNSCEIHTSTGVDCNEADDIYCDGTEIVQDNGYCSEGICELESNVNQDCDNGVWCDGQESCDDSDGVKCINSTQIDCSQNDLLGIASCDNSPDDNPFTFDFRSPFTSFCNEQTDSCISGDTSGASNISHSCNISCGAECIQNSDCDGSTNCSALNGCYSGIFRTYNSISDSCNLNSCGCVPNSCSSANYSLEIDADHDGYSASCGDCDDKNSKVNPGASETCNNIDDNCDGNIDERFTCGGGDGGGGSSGSCNTQWTCGSWSTCDNGIQTRTCSYPEGFCKPEISFPATSRVCIFGDDSDRSSEINNTFISVAPITGAVIGSIGVRWIVQIWIFLLVLILAILLFILKRRSKR